MERRQVAGWSQTLLFVIPVTPKTESASTVALGSRELLGKGQQILRGVWTLGTLSDHTPKFRFYFNP